MDHPDVKDVPEALFTIMKYNILKQLGAAYTFSSIDKESFVDLQEILLSMNYEAKAIENKQKKAQFTEGRDL